ncbi:MAG: alpha/beta hydrolase [Planctomycetaceae bacterium]|nr:alpha/beta hydrolase [Planctomycetaceae bacterium]
MKTLTMRTAIFVILLTLTGTAGINAAEQKTVFLWEQNVPNALGTDEKDKPKFTLYLPDTEKSAGTAVVICPGGGYHGLGMNHEGKQIAEWFNSFGVTAAVLEYRTRGKGYGHPNPLLDVQRAIRTVRKNAEEWKIKPDKIGVMGFSAGGHLASTAGTHFDDHPNPADNTDKLSCRPDFMILCYAVISFQSAHAHRGSQHNLIGKDAPPELAEYYSSEKQVTTKTPPAFLWTTDEDKVVAPESSVEFYLALRQHKIPAELHIYQKGKHGLGLAKGTAGTENWPELCRIWMKNNGFLPHAGQ